MPRSAALLTVVVFALLGGACGDLSQEDLLFRLAVPPKEQIALAPPGINTGTGAPSSTTQAMAVACERFDPRCEAQNIAVGFNGVTFFLLDLVDEIVQYPPTTREVGRRVWGPVLLDGRTIRFEMTREDEGRFRFCLHGAREDVVRRLTRDITCDVDVDEDTGLEVLLSGNFAPGDIAGGRARSGAGDMNFLASRTGRFGDDPSLRGQFLINFDNRDGATDIAMHIEAPDELNVDREADYAYRREADGSGTFLFALYLNFFPRLGADALEEYAITAQWRVDQSGRADASISGGDTPGGVLAGTQCWDAELQTTFRQDADPGVPVEGDAATCAFSEPLR